MYKVLIDKKVFFHFSLNFLVTRLTFSGWLSEEFSFEETSIFFFVEFQVSWTSDTSNSNSFPASNVLSVVGRISNVSTEVWSKMWTFVWAYEGGGWVPLLGGDTFVSSTVQTLVTFLTEFQAQWETRLTISQSTDTLDKVIFEVRNGKVSIRFSITQTVWAINGWWCGSSDWRVGDGCDSWK